MSLYCNPLLSGGLLCLESILIGMTNLENIHQQLINNQDVLLFLIFMITGINLIKKSLLQVFCFIFIKIKSKKVISVMFCILSAFFSAFFDALIVIVVIITAIHQFYNSFIDIYQNKEKNFVKQLRSYLRNLIMQSAVGTTLGGIITMLGEPQNLLIAKTMHWSFIDFFKIMFPISIPILISGILTSIIITNSKIFYYQTDLIELNFETFFKKNFYQKNILLKKRKVENIIQIIIIFFTIFSLIFQLLDIVFVSLSFVILLIGFCGFYHEDKIKKASSEAFPFLLMLILFFIISSVIEEQKIFHPLIQFLLKINVSSIQFISFYLFNGILSSVSDNIFVSSICMNEIQYAFNHGFIDLEKLKKLTLIINIGTNIPSMATPNGQSAFLFVLTSQIAFILKLTYKRMIIMTIPFTIITSSTGLIFILLNQL